MTERKTIYLDDAMLKVAKVDKNKYADMSDFHDACVDCLKNLPSAQPEIIRCKDCRKNPKWEWVGCPMTGKDTRKPDDFCSYAERRTDG